MVDASTISTGFEASEEISDISLGAPATPFNRFAVSLCWNRLGLPDVGCVFGDRPVTREFARGTDVDYRPPRPTLAVLIQLSNFRLCLRVGGQVGQMHEVVAVRQQHITDRTEDTGFRAIEVI